MEGSLLSEPSVPGAKLHAAWVGVLCATQELRAGRIIIEGLGLDDGHQLDQGWSQVLMQGSSAPWRY